MTQVDFYVLPTDALAARLDFACKLSEKAWRLGHRVYVHCADAEQRATLDQRLWAFKGEAFVPHDLAEAYPDGRLVLGLGDLVDGHDDLLVNLGTEVPGFADRFARIAEIVVEAPAAREAARDRFRYYREQGYALHNHRLTRL